MVPARTLLAAAAVVLAAACSPPPGAPRTEPATTVARSGVLVLGDSLSVGASGALNARLPGVEVDAVVSRQFDEAVRVVQERAAAGRLGAGTVVVALGTNGTVTRSRCDELAGLLAPRAVVFVNNAVPRSWELQNNSILAACAHRHGAALVDWKTATLAGGLLGSDGVHFTAAGRERFADLIAARV